MTDIKELADKCRAIYLNAAKALGYELDEASVLDLMADNTEEPLERLKAAIAISGIKAIAEEHGVMLKGDYL